MATASIQCHRHPSRFQNGNNDSADSPSPKKKIASLSKFITSARVAMSFANADLVDGDPPNVFQGRIRESSPEIVLLDFLDHVPGNAQKIGNVLDRHAASQLQCEFGPVLGVASTGIGKANLDLTNSHTIAAPHARQGGDYDGLFQADRRDAAFTLLDAWPDHPVAPARRTADRLFFWLDMEPRDASAELDSNVLVATNAKGLIQPGCGHVRSFKEDLRNLLEDWYVHAFSSLRHTFGDIKPRARFRRLSRKKLPAISELPTGLSEKTIRWRVDR
jgi:hypothetical protein